MIQSQQYQLPWIWMSDSSVLVLVAASGVDGWKAKAKAKAESRALVRFGHESRAPQPRAFHVRHGRRERCICARMHFAQMSLQPRHPVLLSSHPVQDDNRSPCNC